MQVGMTTLRALSVSRFWFRSRLGIVRLMRLTRQAERFRIPNQNASRTTYSGYSGIPDE